MDPVSAAASVAGVLTIVLQTLSLTKKYIDGVRRSEDSAASFAQELEILSSNLHRLQTFLGNGSTHTGDFGQSSMLMSRTKICEKRLQKLSQKLEPVLSSRSKQWIWPLSEREYRESMQDLRAFSQWIQLSLSVDTSILLSKTSDDIVEILTSQLKNIKQLDAIESRTSSLESRLQNQESRLADAHEQEERSRILSWLSEYDYEQKHKYVRSPRVPDTGGWLFSTQEYETWYKSTGNESILWCHGDQGVGKSVLM
jgi:hypothetical protein